MTLSVLTLVKDRPGHLAELVEGLRRSEARPDELIVVDMGSDPPVALPQLPFPARIVRMDRRGLPLAAARNVAARAASGDLLLFLDVDCIPMKGLAGAITATLAAQDALVCAQVLYLGPDHARAQWDEADLVTHAAPHPARSFPNHGVRREENAGLFWSLVFGIRRRRFFDLAGFDEAFTGYGGEDTDFGFRAREAGLPLMFMGGPGAFHQYHDVLDPPLQHLDDIVRNARVFKAKWGAWPMEGWLARFADAGLIAWSDDDIAVTRQPLPTELADALVRMPA